MYIFLSIILTACDESGSKKQEEDEKVFYEKSSEGDTEDTKDVFSSDNSENDLEEDYLADADGDNVIIWKSQCSYHSCEQ